MKRSSVRQSSGFFVPNSKGFDELAVADEQRSPEAVATQLGYHIDQLHPYYANTGNPNFEVLAVFFEVFTNRIVFVHVRQSTLALKNHKVNYYLRNFDPKREYNGLVTASILDKGIANQALPSDFLGRILAIHETASDGIHFVDTLGYYLFFNEGILSDYRPADGLNKWVKTLQSENPALVATCQQEAFFYQGTDAVLAVTSELNRQAQAWAEDVPGGLQNAYIPLHRTGYGAINFVMLAVCQYGKPLSWDDFRLVNHGRYQELPADATGQRRFKVGQFTYALTPEGIMLIR